IGLDGIQMLHPSTSRTLRVYPLDTVTRCEVYDSSTLAFWSKSSVDIEPSPDMPEDHQQKTMAMKQKIIFLMKCKMLLLNSTM
ncbi:hypothetical protein Tco_1488812, partial [Tanacetum coccineum]